MVGNFIASNDFGSRTSIISGLKSRAIFSVTKYTIKIFWKLKRSTNFIWFLFRRKEEAQPLKNICLSVWFDKEHLKHLIDHDFLYIWWLLKEPFVLCQEFMSNRQSRTKCDLVSSERTPHPWLSQSFSWRARCMSQHHGSRSQGKL